MRTIEWWFMKLRCYLFGHRWKWFEFYRKCFRCFEREIYK